MAAYTNTKYLMIFANKFSNCTVLHKKFSSVGPLLWNIYGAVLLERKPVISEAFQPLEQQFHNLLETMEYENSIRNDHELRQMDDMQRKEKMKMGALSDADLEASSIQTAQDFEDIANDLLSQFHPAPRSTKWDSDGHSLKHYLSRSVLLLLKTKHSDRWQVPVCMHRDGETLRQTAERSLINVFEPSLHARFLGNAPIGFYKFKYNSNVRCTDAVNNAHGGKVFFFRAHYVKGVVSVKEWTDTTDYSWATREELRNFLYSNNDYLKCIQTLLTEEGFIYEPSEAFLNKYWKHQTNI